MANPIAWICLFLAVIFEVAGTTSMKLSAGFTNIIPSILIFIFYGLSLFFLTLCIKKMPLGFAYAFWSAVGTLLIFFIGVIFFQEALTILKFMSVIFIIVGVLGLKQGE